MEVIEVFARIQGFLREKKWTFAHLFKSKRINHDQSQFLNKTEFENLLTSKKFLGLDVSKEDIDKVFDAVDADKTGRLNLLELDRAISSVKINLEGAAGKSTAVSSKTSAIAVGKVQAQSSRTITDK